MNQKQFIHDYIEKTTDRFNPVLFQRSDDAIIDSLKKIILSCQRDSFFKIIVKNFKVIDNYGEIIDILKRYQDYLQNKPTSKRKDEEDNKYNFIDLKESALKLLIVTYYIEIKGESDTLDVIIAVPKVVDKFYFLLNGSYYSAMFQIVDASTYNNGTSKSKYHSVTLKSHFQPIRIFRNINDLHTTSDELVHVTQYDCKVFKKTVSASLYIFAQYGYYGALDMLGIGNAFSISEYDVNDEMLYTFKARKANLYISVPKILLDGNPVIQHVTNLLVNYMDSNANFNSIFSKEYWVTRLGACFNSTNSYEKGLSVLMSIKGIYDISTKEELHLPEKDKENIFTVLRWMIREYNNLKMKDNLNIPVDNLAPYIVVI